MKNIILDGQTYSGISEVSLPVSGGTALFKDKDEIPAAPSGTKQISANGTYDVTAFASAEVNVGGDAPTLITKEITENGNYNASADGADGYSSISVNVSSGGGGGLQSFRATTSGSNHIEINTGAHDLTNASIINVQFVCQSTSREATTPNYAQYAGTVTYISPIMSAELETACSAKTSQGGTEFTPTPAEVIKNRNAFVGKTIGKYFSQGVTNNNWDSEFTINFDSLKVTLNGVYLDPALTYDVIVHYV